MFIVVFDELEERQRSLCKALRLKGHRVLDAYNPYQVIDTEDEDIRNICEYEHMSVAKRTGICRRSFAHGAVCVCPGDKAHKFSENTEIFFKKDAL